MKLGAQFYSIRDNTKTPEDLRKSFEEMQKIGYEVAQMSAICPMDPYKLLSYSEEYNLPITCTHSPLDRILNDTDALIKEHQIYKCPVIGLGSMPENYRKDYDSLKQFFKDIEEPMKKIENAGLKFAYHNHAFEFNKFDGRLIYDIMIEDCPHLNFIMDTYWVSYAGYDPLHYIEKIGVERMTNVHFKDMKNKPQGPICPCGEGVLDFKPIIALCDKLGIPNALVEQDNAPDTGDSFGQMAISFKNLKPLF